MRPRPLFAAVLLALAGLAAPAGAADPAPANAWIAGPGESLHTMAQALFPGEGLAQRRFVSAVQQANPGIPALADPAAELPEGMRLQVPDLRRIAAQPTQPPRARARSRGAAPVLAASIAKRAPAEAPAAPADASLIAMSDKLDELERLEARLRQQIAAMDVQIAQARAARAPSPVAVAPAAPASVATATPAPRTSGMTDLLAWSSWGLGGALGMVGMGALGYLRRRDRDADASAPPHLPATPAAAPRPVPAERADPACELLWEHLDEAGARKYAPWLPLLEGLRGAGMREEYESLSRRVGQNYNVRIPQWGAANAPAPPADGRAAIEAYPHVLKRLIAFWGEPAAFDYLELLLKDNRQGTRGGFPMEVLGELLVLMGIAEEQRQERAAARTHLRRVK